MEKLKERLLKSPRLPGETPEKFKERIDKQLSRAEADIKQAIRNDFIDKFLITDDDD